ncbi:hypothetical protein ACVWZW_008902 [Bradyrhizobium sp. F1.13.4]
MSIKTKIFAVALTALTLTGSVVATTSQAQAKPLGWGVGVGLGIAHRGRRRLRDRRQQRPLLQRLSPLRLGRPVQRLWPVRWPRSYLLLI